MWWTAAPCTLRLDLMTRPHGIKLRPQHPSLNTEPFPWNTFTCELRRQKSVGARRTGRSANAQVDSSGLSATPEEPLRMRDARSEWRENKGDKCLGRGLSTWAPGVQVRTQRAFLARLIEVPGNPTNLLLQTYGNPYSKAVLRSCLSAPHLASHT